LSVAGFSSCADETQPVGATATSDQLGQSSAALEALAAGIPSSMSQGYLVYGEQEDETDLGYPLYMVAQEELMGNIYPGGEEYRYDWWWSYNTFSRNIGSNSVNAFLPWFTMYKFIKSANDVIAAVSWDNAGTNEKGIAASAYASRAFYYYMLSVCYEPVENIYTDVSKVLGLTVPKVLPETTKDDAKNNPRLTHAEMLEFILSDLDKAEEGLKNYDQADRKLPSLPVVYGIRAKVYLWDKDYANAAKYARMAIDAQSGVPMTEDEWTNPTTGFTTATSGWMWYATYIPEQMSNLANFVGHMSYENDWGYAPLTQPMIDAALYNSIPTSDFRKHVFYDPKGFDFYEYQSSRGKAWLKENAVPYAALKFRCKNGDYQSYKIGGATDIPIMRVEEMYYIEALAKGEQNLADGVAALKQFVSTYRNPNYGFTTTNKESFEREILNQMRVEFWGEGNSFPIGKLLQLGTVQNYVGTNAPNDYYRTNCKGIKPNWNFVIPTSEVNANKALVDKNNPDPTTAIDKYPTPVGEWAKAK
jgi:hypothetical protein